MKKLILFISLLFITTSFAQYESSYTGTEIDAGVRPYKVYTALLTQIGTNAPVATVVENTLGFTPVWFYGGGGFAYIRQTNAWPEGKTIGFASTGLIQGAVKPFYAYRIGNDDFGLRNDVDDEYTVTIEIRVYP